MRRGQSADARAAGARRVPAGRRGIVGVLPGLAAAVQEVASGVACVLGRGDGALLVFVGGEQGAHAGPATGHPESRRARGRVPRWMRGRTIGPQPTGGCAAVVRRELAGSEPGAAAVHQARAVFGPNLRVHARHEGLQEPGGAAVRQSRGGCAGCAGRGRRRGLCGRHVKPHGVGTAGVRICVL